MHCKHCDKNLAVHDLWCSNCGHQTPIVNQDLSAWASLRGSWAKLRGQLGSNIPAAAVVILLGIIPTAVILYLLHSFGWLDLAASQTAGSLISQLLLTGIAVAVFIPILVMPARPVCADSGYITGWKKLLASFNDYPKYLALGLMCSLYYLLIYLICFGLPNFGSDPILRLVWVVLVTYFLAVLLPVPTLMERLRINAWTALKTSYKYFHVVRWQLFLLLLVLGLINALAVILVLIPLLVTLPLSWYAVRDYVDKLLEYEIIRDKPRKKA